MGERLTEFMKVQKNCGLSTTDTCFSSTNRKNLAGQKLSGSYNEWAGYKFITADGTSVYVNFWTKGFNTANVFGPDAGADIYVDIDGPNRGSNTQGKDLFRFLVTTKGIFPEGTTHPSTMFQNGAGAAAWVIEYGNMDYLQAKNAKCPDGKTVLDWTTNTTCK